MREIYYSLDAEEWVFFTATPSKKAFKRIVQQLLKLGYWVRYGSAKS
jgi:hypothetical protein